MLDDFEWTVLNEGQLLDAMVGHKPVGINKYFQMAFILDKFTENMNKDVQPEKIWEHLETMYNLEALDENEALPFPNDEQEFYLPESEFGALKLKKDEKIEERKSVQKGRETPKMLKEINKEDKPQNRAIKDSQRRDSKDSKDGKQTPTGKKELKKEPEKVKAAKGRNSVGVKEEPKVAKTPKEETPRAVKRATRGNQKADDSGSSGKGSPLTVTPSGSKRRRI